MGEPSTPKHLTPIHHESDLSRAPIYLAPHYPSSTNISDAKANFKTILATRVSFNDPNIINALIKPDEISDHFVKTTKDYISSDQVILDFLTHVRSQAFDFDSDMYKPLVGRNRYPYPEDS